MTRTHHRCRVRPGGAAHEYHVVYEGHGLTYSWRARLAAAASAAASHLARRRQGHEVHVLATAQVACGWRVAAVSPPESSRAKSVGSHASNTRVSLGV